GLRQDWTRIAKNLGSVVAQAQSVARAETKLKEDWSRKIAELAAKDKVALWGAGAKGVTFANLIDGSRQLIDCVVDLNPLKQGHYVPGTGHPIVSYQDLTARGVSTAILMNANYRGDNLAFLRQSQA